MMRMKMKLVLAMVLAVAGVVASVPGAPGAGARPLKGTVVAQREGRPVTLSFTTERTGEALVDLTASADDADWATPGAESAVVSVFVDGRYATDLVVMSDAPVDRRLALGHLEAGEHTLELRFAADRSPLGAERAKLRQLSVEVVKAGDQTGLALRHAPVLYGRSIPVANSEGTGVTYDGPFQNAVTDTPVLAWHEILPATTSDNRILEYSVVWSNEDGGTNSPALMARWGRTTDIEWIYRVEVDAEGAAVPGTAVYQGPDHATVPFGGAYESDHPLLQTCTANNMVCDDLVDAQMRFFLAADATRPPDRAREVLMDTNPWTYSVMAAEMVREGKVEPEPSPATTALGDQRSYLYIEVDKDTLPPNPSTGPWVGLALEVRLAGDPTGYRSDHLTADWSIKRDVPAATTVELPLGTTAADVAEIIAHRVVVGDPDSGANITVTDINRAFFLDDSYQPQPSFVDWHGSATLSPAQPAVRLWARDAASGSPPSDELPLGRPGLSETRTSTQLAPGVTHTRIVRGEASEQDTWIVDVAIVANKEQAKVLDRRLQAAGFDARTESIDERPPDDAGDDPLGYLVRVGRFASEAEAGDVRDRLVAAGYAGLRVVYSGEDGGRTTGPWVVNVLEVAPEEFEGEVAPALATAVVPGLERLTDIADRSDALAAVNGGYFVIQPADGTPGDLAGISVLDGALVSEAVNGRTSLLLPEGDGTGASVAALSSRQAAVSSDGAEREVDGLNRKPGLVRGCGGTGGDTPTEAPKHDFTCSDAGELILFTPVFGSATEPGEGAEAVLDASGTVIELRDSRGGAVPPTGSVLSGTGDGARWLRAHAQPGTTVATTTQVLADGKPVATGDGLGVVNGGPRLLRGGQLDINAAAEGFHWEEKPEFYYRFGVRRNPRTLAGVTSENHLLLVTVDGRQPGWSVGASFVESALIMKALGASDAVNLDGGGSTTMTVGSELLTRPSDPTGERPIADSVVIAP